MEFNIESFNGEINEKLKYRIPLKQQPDSDNPGICENTQQAYSSPLFECEPFNNINNFMRNRIPFTASHTENVKPVSTYEYSPAKRRKLEGKEALVFGRDDSYPSELNSLIFPFSCDLCKAKLNSIKTAQFHYESKIHKRKCNNWLEEWRKKTGEQPQPVQKAIKEGPTGPNALHCDPCDLNLTSVQHARQHYSGKRHRMVLARAATPSGAGYYNEDGKWVRTILNPPTNSRFGIGDQFVNNSESVVVEPEVNKGDPSKYCATCEIYVTSDQQMQMHLQGSKHGKKLKNLGQPPFASPGDTILASVQNTTRNDVSIYRTPSGHYYCEICNITISDDTIFKQHLEGKKHNKNFKMNEHNNCTSDSK